MVDQKELGIEWISDTFDGMENLVLIRDHHAVHKIELTNFLLNELKVDHIQISNRAYWKIPVSRCPSQLIL